MHTVNFKCEVITPLFMYGAKRDYPELRPSQFKGMMRFWWRAVMSKPDIEDLKQREEMLFGGTGDGGRKSGVMLRIEKERVDIDEYKLVPHKEFKSKAFSPESRFTLKFVCKDDSNIKIYEYVLYISTILGGFGKRSRRGFGCIQIINKPVSYDIKEICSMLNQISGSHRFEVKNGKIVNISAPPSNVKNAYPWIVEIEIGREVSSFFKLLEIISNASHKFKDYSLGGIKPTRMASPIYVSVIRRDKDVYLPVVTTLNFVPPPKYPRGKLENQKEFKKYILNFKG